MVCGLGVPYLFIVLAMVEVKVFAIDDSFVILGRCYQKTFSLCIKVF